MNENTPTGFNAFGKPVPAERKSAGLAHVREMIPGVSSQDAHRIVGVVSEAIERDDIYRSMKASNFKAGAGLDLTGIYRLTAVMCSEPIVEPN